VGSPSSRGSRESPASDFAIEVRSPAANFAVARGGAWRLVVAMSRRIPGRQYCSHWQYCSLSAPHSLGNGGRNGLRDLRVSSLRSSARARGNDRALRLCFFHTGGLRATFTHGFGAPCGVNGAAGKCRWLCRRRAAGAGCQPAHLQRSGGTLRAALPAS
jgi:hypothetical protein